MRLPMMNIEYFHWSAIPLTARASTLASIRVGDYVWSLPVSVSDGANEVVFPLPRTEPIRRDVMDTNEMRFKRESYTDGIDKVDVWKRVK